VEVAGLSGLVSAIDAGPDHNLALKSDGSVVAWGYNSDGQLGDGTNEDRSTPVVVAGLSRGVVAISAGGYARLAGNHDDGAGKLAGPLSDHGHSLAVRADGSVAAWGFNSNGQLGDGTTASRRRPVLVTGLPPAKTVSAGGQHSLAIAQDGTVWQWGRDHATGGQYLSPVKIMDGPVKEISAGERHNLALMEDGSLYAWGDGHLGDGARRISSVPVRVLAVPPVQAISSGSANLALTTAGSVLAWGFNNWGQAGNPNTNAEVLFPAPVLGLNAAVVAVAAGQHHGLAVRADGSVLSWGSNYQGRLGNGKAGEPSIVGLASDFVCYCDPAPVLGLPIVATTVTAGRGHSLAANLVPVSPGVPEKLPPSDPDDTGDETGKSDAGGKDENPPPAETRDSQFSGGDALKQQREAAAAPPAPAQGPAPPAPAQGQASAPAQTTAPAPAQAPAAQAQSQGQAQSQSMVQAQVQAQVQTQGVAQLQPGLLVQREKQIEAEVARVQSGGRGPQTLLASTLVQRPTGALLPMRMLGALIAVFAGAALLPDPRRRRAVLSAEKACFGGKGGRFDRAQSDHRKRRRRGF